MKKEIDLQGALEDGFAKYSVTTIQTRAIIDVRDGLKPSARQALYGQYLIKNFPNKRYLKSPKAYSEALSKFYTHGDTSLYDLMIRMAKPFAMRYRIEEVQGNTGTLKNSNDHAAARYTEMRLSDLGLNLIKGIEKDTIQTWYEGFDGESYFPSVFPSMGFYNIVNGTMGIAVAVAPSIPQFNIEEVNTALIKLLNNPNINDEELICMPDFCTGGILINGDEVKESLLKGKGKSCVLRAKIDYDKKENCLIITELPYSVYTETITGEIEKLQEKLLNGEIQNVGISRFLDLTGELPLLKIYLEKNADVSRVLSILYKETSLQSHFGINMTMLKDGKNPQLFTWKQALQEHIDHEKICYLKSFTFDKDKILNRLHILEGLIKACDNIEDIVQLIKLSKDKTIAKNNLKEKYSFSDKQAEAILKLTLARLITLEVNKFKTEYEDLEQEYNSIMLTLNNESIFNKVIEKGFIETMNRLKDPRRTKVLNKLDEDESRLLYFTQDGKAFLNKPKGEKVLNSISAGTPYMAITEKGMVYRNNEVPGRAKKVFLIDSDDIIIKVLPCFENEHLVIYTRDKKFRCLAIKGLNKKKTKLTLTDLVDAYTSEKKVTKSQYRK